MIEVVKYGDMFDDKADVLVNPVNLYGVMGAGLAKEFKRRYPTIIQSYRFVLDQKTLTTEQVAIHWETNNERPHVVALFATKDNWREPSRLEYIRGGLKSLHETILALRDDMGCKELPFNTIAMPALGCGLGGLKWEDVLSLVEAEFKDSPIHVRIYKPR